MMVLRVVAGRVAAGSYLDRVLTRAFPPETRRLTLLDLEQFLDLWISHYDRIAEDKKLMLPLRPAYYLAPS